MNQAVFHLAQHGQRTGPFTLEQVQEMWRAGTLSPETLYWQAGQTNWEPLGSLVPYLVNTPSPGEWPPRPVLPPAASYPAASAGAYGPPTTSGLAIASFVLGLASLLLFITFLPAIICGHLALAEIKRSAGRLVGRGFAVTGLLLGYFFPALLGLGILAGILLPLLGAVSQQGDSAKELAQAKQVGLALKLYEGDNDGKTPPTLEELFPTYLSDRSLLLSPLSKKGDSPALELVLPATKVTELDPRTVVLRGRFTTRSQRRVYVYNDGSAELKRTP